MKDFAANDLRLAKRSADRLAFYVRGWAAWTPGRETEAAWRAWAGQSVCATDDASPVPPAPTILRRRVSPLGQAALRAAWGLPDVATSRIVSASRHGEFGRTLSILRAIAARDGVSPADFTLSVHHALIGLLSIATGNRHGHTAIAAGPESFGFGLVECLGCLAEDPATTVTFLFYDECLPAPFSDFGDDREQPLVIALSLGAAEDEGRYMTLETSPAASGASSSIQALDFMRALLTEDTAIWTGERFQWRWGHHAAVA